MARTSHDLNKVNGRPQDIIISIVLKANIYLINLEKLYNSYIIIANLMELCLVVEPLG